MTSETLVMDEKTRNEARDGLDRYLARRVREVNLADVEEWRRLGSLADWEAFIQPRIEALERSLGTFPAVPDRVGCEVVREVEGDGYVIDCVVFEARDGIDVTANVWRPDGEANGVGFVLVHSHHNPRTQVELQDMGAMWAKVGCSVLVMDQFAYGERRIHPEGARHDYWNRYNTGIQLHAIGDSLMGWMVWDIRRGIDVLEQRYGVNRVVMIGSVAGGGDPCAVAAALDERVEVSVPFNFGGPQPETAHPLPDDAEMAFNYLGSGSWETTRNLAWSGRDGFLPWVIVAAAAPRKLIYAHEFAWDREKDPVWKRLQTIYDWYGVPDHLDWVKGFGGVKLRPPNASHCNNVGPVHRERIHQALERWLGVEGVVDAEDRRDEGELFCYPGESTRRREDAKKGVGTGGGGGVRRDYLQVLRGIRGERQWEGTREAWAEVLGDVEPSVLEGEMGEGGVVFREEGEVCAVAKVVRRGGDGADSVTVMVSGRGKDFVVERHGDVVEEVMRDGDVCVVDVRGIGELAPEEERTFRSRCAARAATALMVGESGLGIQLRDLRGVIGWLRREGYERIRVRGFVEAADYAGVEGPERGRDYPEGNDEVVARRYVEPAGAALAKLAGVFEDVAVEGEVDFGEVLASSVVRWPMDCVVPGMGVMME